MANMIGFANKYYTLWSYRNEDTFITDAYGNSYKSGGITYYNYIKNISMDLNKVKELYPELIIDEGLRGKSRDFSITTNKKGPDGYFWFGKYYGKLITEVAATDFGYCQWVVENSHKTEVIDAIKATPEWIAHIEKMQRDEEDAMAEISHIQEGQTIELTFRSNGFNAWWSNDGEIEYIYSEEENAYINGYDRVMTDAQIDGWDGTIRVVHKGLKHVNGRFPYTMPMINGKCRRAKNKTFEVTITRIVHKSYYAGEAQLTIEID